MKKTPRQSLADYLTISISPALIMALVGSLIFFLLEVLYVGQYSGRMQWTLFFFVFGIVLVARISIEQGGGRATLYGIALALVVWLALQAFIEYPPVSAIRFYGWAINLGLIGLAWWCTHRLTWDCTYIDDQVDASGKGVLEAAGLDERGEQSADREAEVRQDSRAESADARDRHSRGLLAWWARYRRYRAEQLRKPHTPGVWVVYFSLAALPLFGLGQALIPAGDVGRRYYAFWLMVWYVGSGLALLVTTSFLGLRRYLRQRKLTMPAAMTGVWMALGGGLIIILMVVGALLPRPYGEYQIVNLDSLGTKDRSASQYAVLRDGAGKGEGRSSVDKSSQTKDAQAGSSNQSDGKKGQPGGGKGSGGKGDQGGKGAGRQADQRPAAKDRAAARQDTSQGNPRSGNEKRTERSRQSSGRSSDQNDGDSSNREKEEEQKEGRDRTQKRSGSDSARSQAHGNTSSPSRNPIAPLVQTLGRLGTILKWLLFTVLALAVLFFILRSGLNFLANFTNWAQRLLAALAAWWQGLFGRDERELEAESEEPAQRPRPRPFASFSNPFADGRAAQLSVDALTRYSFEALQAWAGENGLDRQPQETPLEFAERLGTAVPNLEAEVRGLAGLYVRLAYARSSLTPACLDLLKQFWKQLTTLEDKPVSI